MDCFYNILCYITQLSNSMCLNLSINRITLQLDFRSLLNFLRIYSAFSFEPVSVYLNETELSLACSVS